MNPKSNRFEELPPLGRYGSMNWMGTAENINATDEERSWPMVDAVPPKFGMLVLEPGVNINPTDEELTWPIVPGGQVFSLPEAEAPPTSPPRRGRGE